MLRAWIKFQGVSRGTTINLRDIEIVLAVLRDRFWNFESAKLLFRDLFRVTAQNQMNLVRGAVDLL